jgi:hypothetical protein
MSYLLSGPMTPDDIDMAWGFVISQDEVFLRDLASMAKPTVTNHRTVFRLSDHAGWHPFVPFFGIREALDAMRSYIAKHRDTVVRFPPINPNMESVLLSPLLFAIEFEILTSLGSEREIVQYVSNLLISAAACAPETEIISESVLSVSSLEELIAALSDLPFRTFLQISKFDMGITLSAHFCQCSLSSVHSDGRLLPSFISRFQSLSNLRRSSPELRTSAPSPVAAV